MKIELQDKDYNMDKRRYLWICLFVGLSVLFMSAYSVAAGIEPSKLIGKDTWNFNLASSHDRLINYGDEYYGRTYLIMTFFPAAFTPV
ncbi:MAG: hypothetical protein ACXWMH_02115 [Syntrophales bacterium]